MARRRAILVSALIGLLICVLIVLTSGIGHVDLEPGRQITGSGSGRGLSGEWSMSSSRTITLPIPDLFRFVFPVLLALLVVSTVLSVRDRRIPPHLLFTAFALGVMVLVMIFTNGSNFDESKVERAEAEEETTAEAALSGTPRVDPLHVEAGPQQGASRWSMIVTAVLASVLVALTASPLVFLFLRWRRRKRLADDRAHEILDIAADAAREIRDGADVVGVVQRCYARMLRALSDRSGVNPRFRTPREFAAAMREVGLHSESVDALTEMFELVRYGGRRDEPFAAKARGCLTSLRLHHETS
jgi:hypothetical protein